MKNWKVWTAFVLVFFLGATCGVLGSGYVVKKRLSTFRELRANGVTGGKRFLRKIEQKVQPDKQTMKEIRSIVAKNKKELRAVREKSAEEAMQIIEKNAQEINAVLTPEQQKKFAKVMNIVRKRIERLRILRSVRE